MKKIISPSIFLYSWSIICFLFSEIYLSVFALFLISPIVKPNSSVVFQSTLIFLSISNLRVATIYSSNGLYGLRINSDNPSTCPNLYILTLLFPSMKLIFSMCRIPPFFLEPNI